NRRRSPVQRQLDAYEESWLQNHKDALECRDLEDTLAVGIGLYRILAHADRVWRERVFRGAEELSSTTEDSIRESFRAWLQVSELVQGAVSTLEERFGAVESAVEFRTCVDQVRGLLQTWQSPSLSRAVGLREMDISPESAASLQKIIDEAKRHPPPMPTR